MQSGPREVPPRPHIQVVRLRRATATSPARWPRGRNLAQMLPLAEQPRLEMRHNAVVIKEEQASRYGEREDDRAAFVFIRRGYAARRCTQPRRKRAPAPPTRPPVVISP